MATPSFPQASLNGNNGDHQHIDADVPVALERYVFLSIILFSSICQPLPPHQLHGNDLRDSDDGQWQEQTTIRIFCTK